MRQYVLAGIIAILGGFPVQAVKLDLFPDRAMYRPGETVNLILEHRDPERPRVVNATLKVFSLEREIHSETKALDLSKPDPMTFAFSPEPNAAGYGAELTLTEADTGRVLEVTSSAFDVHRSWLEAPRYGFLSDFGPGAPDDDRVSQLSKSHVNALQFYDWMYRHDQHLPPEAEFSDPLGRRMSLEVIERRIDQAHAVGMAAMPYTTIYAASMSYYRDHPEQALYRFNTQPWNFGDDFLMTMNPAPGSGWREHILTEYRRILEALPFDGLHIDQYGDPKIAADRDGKIVQLADVIPGFIKDAKRVASGFPGRDTVIFNLVNDWPVETVAPSGVDAVYIEVWPPHDDYSSLRDIIRSARKLSGGKPVILTAYLTARTDYGTRLLNAVITANGGTHLELGEDDALLADPYFPKYEHPGPELSMWLRRHYDFITRYQHYLYDTTPLEKPELSLTGAPFTAGSFPQNAVWGLTARGEHFETIHLINLTSSPLPLWRVKKERPQPQSNLEVHVTLEKPVRAVYAASPDHATGGLQPLEFHQDAGSVRLKLPHLETWTMIVLETE